MSSLNTAVLPAQVRLLTRMIEREPGVPVHYLLRGEEWLVLGDVTKARADFEQVCMLVTELLSESSWGYVLQAYLDRAALGLRHCEAGG